MSHWTELINKTFWEIPDDILTKLDTDYLNARISELTAVKKPTDTEKQELE